MIQPFDLLAELPTGTTLLEASAGTGKTFTVGALVARHIAEGVCSLDELLVVTFGRAASQELREGVRDQLVRVAAALADPSAAASGDQLIALLAQGSETEVAQRRQRVVDALATFDSATIATTHQFCQIVLKSLGVAGDTDPGVTLIEDFDDLLVEVVDDIFLSRYGGLDAASMSRTDMLKLARAVFTDPHSEITPVNPELGSVSQERVEVAGEVRAHMDKVKRARGLMSFDDLLSTLAAALDDLDSPARRRMSARWKVVLVDEFQDTDPVQWQVLDRAFTGVSTLILVGDPKQAIYAFRGGDIDSYLGAVTTARERRTLSVNHRSDAPLVDALQVLTRGAALGNESISVQPVAAALSGSRLHGAPVNAPVRLRVVDLPDDERLPSIGQFRDRIAQDLADDIARLLSSGATFGRGQDARPVGPGDVAILMRSLNQAPAIEAALKARGVACVTGDRGSVLASEAAGEWVRLLEALERQSSERVRSVALTSFYGRSVPEVAGADDSVADQLAEQLRELRDIFRSRGIAAVYEALSSNGVAARVLSQTGGERLMTDLEHVAELLHATAHQRHLGLSALLSWLIEERRTAIGKNGASSVAARHRRLDTDAAAVQIVTIHSSKGLQYPIVYLPHSFDRWIMDVGDETALLHHVSGQRLLDVGRPFDASVVHASRAEDAKEELRLTYVALTRAQSQVVAWWGRSANSVHSGLSRLLLGRGPGEATVPLSLPRVPDMSEALHKFQVWQSAGGLLVEQPHDDHHEVPAKPADTTQLQARAWQRSVDADWRRTSYSGLLRAAENAVVSLSEPEVEGTVDEAEPDQEAGSIAVRDSAGDPTPMSDLPAGAGFGSLIHAVLEHADPQASDLATELHAVVTEQLRWWPTDSTADEIAESLVPVHDTPLGPLLDDLTLRDIGQRDRLNELDFEIPLAGGDRPERQVEVRLAQIADALRRHLPPDDILVHYADHLSGPLAGQVLRGYLGGSIDAVMRVGVGDSQRFVVVDYKTNRLGVPDHPVTVHDYRPEFMAESMIHSHYPLQALLYSVVLHRYLRWRLPKYDPNQHLGGIAYLYVRGMAGPQTPLVNGMRCGAFAWQPPAAMIVELSDTLAGFAEGDR